MWFERGRTVHLEVPRALLNAVFDECDRYDDVETGGRVIGNYESGRKLDLHITGMIDAGPRARRARTSFFQDGEYQERVFRQVEEAHPDIEHVGTWHTHHVNGLENLSGGDIETYRRTVNHPQHNLDFWYALLVTRKVPDARRYLVKHYVFFRDDAGVYEIPQKRVAVTERSVVWLPGHGSAHSKEISARVGGAILDATPREQRAIDDKVLRRLFPGLKPFYSRAAEHLCWKGPLILLDESKADILVAESIEKGTAHYEAAITRTERARFPEIASVSDDSPWTAARALEKALNRAIAGFAHINDEGGGI